MDFRSSAIRLLPFFERGELGRVLNTVAPVLRDHFDVASQTVFGDGLFDRELESFQRIVAVHEAMLGRARAAISCWTMVGVCCGVFGTFAYWFSGVGRGLGVGRAAG
jgi:hypothetical protein